MENVLFDLDGTICEYERSSSELLETSFKEIGVEQFFRVEEYTEMVSELVGDSEDQDERRRRCFEKLAERKGYEKGVGRELASVYSGMRDYSEVRFMPGAREVLDELRSINKPVGLVTNGEPGMQEEKLEELCIKDIFDTVVFAGHNVPAKPSPEPFEIALNELGASPSETVYVGDSVKQDVVGANRVGIESVWVRNDRESTPEKEDGDDEPDYTVESVDELFRIGVL